MAEITCVFDACSIINLIHIDDNDFLLKKLKRIDFYICQEVFKEVELNVLNRLNKEEERRNLKQRKLEIDEALKFYRVSRVSNEKITHELKSDFFDEVARISGYKKKNGEFYSACLALFISRFKKFESSDVVASKVFFHTDDSPAQNEFSSFFRNQQIGYIEDTADLLVLLYRLEDSQTFSRKDLENYLSMLFQEYALEVTILNKKLKSLKENLSLSQRKDRDLMKNINGLVAKLSKLDFNGISKFHDFFKRKKSKYVRIWEILSKYNIVFDLESNSNDLLEKINRLKAEIPNIYRL